MEPDEAGAGHERCVEEARGRECQQQSYDRVHGAALPDDCDPGHEENTTVCHAPGTAGLGTTTTFLQVDSPADLHRLLLLRDRQVDSEASDRRDRQECERDPPCVVARLHTPVFHVNHTYHT